MQAVSGPLSKALGWDVTVQPAGGDGGWTAINQLTQDTSGTSVIATSSLNLATRQYYGDQDFSLALINPVAQFANGFAVSLVAPRGADYATWEALSAAAGQREFKLASTGPHSAFGVAKTMFSKVLGTDFIGVHRNANKGIYDAVVGGGADLGIMTDSLITSFNDASATDGVVPVVNFSSNRTADSSDTPTLAEVSGNDTLFFTIALGLFGSQKMTEATAESVYRALVTAAGTPEYAETGYPTAIEDGATVREAYERELALLAFLDTP